MTINIDEFRKYLEIDGASLDDEVRRHASLLFKISEAMVEAIAKRDYFKEHLASMDAKIDQDLRASFEEDGVKYTESQIKSLILIDKTRCAINAKLLEAKAEADKLIALKDAFHSRGYMIRDLVSLYVANYYEDSSVRTTPQTDETVYKLRRARLAEGRKNRGE